jgi:lipoprotein-releasing system ATP-binding protein
VDLAVEEGEILTILGPSGAGKSTLLYMLGALERPTAGVISFRDTDMSRISKKETARIRGASFGFVFQFHHLMPELSVVENVMSPGLFVGRRGGLRTRAGEVLREFGLSERANHMPSQISGGERQRVAVARALFNSPEVIFCDEPTGNLDSVTGKMIKDLITDINREKGTTFVIVTHDESFVEMSARSVRMVDGTIA